MELILATRKSKLAQTQTETVMAMLKDKHKIDATTQSVFFNFFIEFLSFFSIFDLLHLYFI